MSRTGHLATGAVLMLVGTGLVLFAPETDLGWFRGHPLGVVLLILGVIDVAEGVRKPGSRDR